MFSSVRLAEGNWITHFRLSGCLFLSLDFAGVTALTPMASTTTYADGSKSICAAQTPLHLRTLKLMPWGAPPISQAPGM